MQNNMDESEKSQIKWNKLYNKRTIYMIYEKNIFYMKN